MLTDWFPPEVKPVHRGLYIVHLQGDPSMAEAFSPFFCVWDGFMWMAGSHRTGYAIESARLNIPSCHQDKYWRGITKDEYDHKIKLGMTVQPF